jgi:hypothetical protein
LRDREHQGHREAHSGAGGGRSAEESYHVLLAGVATERERTPVPLGGQAGRGDSADQAGGGQQRKLTAVDVRPASLTCERGR